MLGTPAQATARAGDGAHPCRDASRANKAVGKVITRDARQRPGRARALLVGLGGIGEALLDLGQNSVDPRDEDRPPRRDDLSERRALTMLRS